MVTHREKETKDEPEYSLQAVHRLAGFRQIHYAGTRVQRHVANLGYNLDDVGRLLGTITPDDFQHSERYLDHPNWHDVYFLRHPVVADPAERLYIKFRLSNDCLYVDLCSFHPEGWL